MNILQITDLHLCRKGEKAFLHADSGDALRHSIDYFLQSRIPADLMVVSGDVSSDGSLDSYEYARQELSRLPFPVYCIPGNHDDHKNMAKAGLIPADPSDSVCRILNLPEADLVLLDSTRKGESRGGVSSAQLEFVENALRQAEGKPVFLFLHHTPFITGYTVMDEPFEGMDAFHKLLNAENLVVCCGHIHASISAHLKGAAVIACPPVSMEMEFDLSEKGGDMFYLSEPGFAFHVVDGTQVITHFAFVPDGTVREGPYTFSV